MLSIRKKRLIKIVFTCLISIVLLFCAGIIGYMNGVNQAPAQTQSQNIAQAKETTADPYVYVSPSGEKYHKKTCQFISGRRLKSYTREDAERKGYEACASCNP